MSAKEAILTDFLCWCQSRYACLARIRRVLGFKKSDHRKKHAQSSYNICKLRLKELSRKRQRYTAEDQLYILSHIVFTLLCGRSVNLSFYICRYFINIIL